MPNNQPPPEHIHEEDSDAEDDEDLNENEERPVRNVRLLNHIERGQGIPREGLHLQVHNLNFRVFEEPGIRRERRRRLSNPVPAPEPIRVPNAEPNPNPPDPINPENPPLNENNPRNEDVRGNHVIIVHANLEPNNRNM